MENNEQVIFTNHFGTVTSKRVILNYKRGTADFPIGQISSVSFQHQRNYFFAISSFIAIVAILIPMLTNLSNLKGTVTLLMSLLIVFFLLSGIANWLGHYNIVISASGQKQKMVGSSLRLLRMQLSNRCLYL